MGRWTSEQADLSFYIVVFVVVFYQFVISFSIVTIVAEAIASTSDVQEKGGSSCRGNTDSGFISEASDDLLLRRDMSVESLPGATGLDRAGEATPSMSSPECTTEEGQGMAEGGEGVVQDGGVAQGGDKSGEDAKPVVVEEVWDEAKVSLAVYI